MLFHYSALKRQYNIDILISLYMLVEMTEFPAALEEEKVEEVATGDLKLLHDHKFKQAHYITV